MLLDLNSLFVHPGVCAVVSRWLRALGCMRVCTCVCVQLVGLPENVGKHREGVHAHKARQYPNRKRDIFNFGGTRTQPRSSRLKRFVPLPTSALHPSAHRLL